MKKKEIKDFDWLIFLCLMRYARVCAPALTNSFLIILLFFANRLICGLTYARITK